MIKTRFGLMAVILVAISTLCFSVFAANPWPADSGTGVGASLATVSPAFETSGIAYNSQLDKLITVSDEGPVCTLNPDGSQVICYNPGHYDLEGVTIADQSTNQVYLAVEYPYGILEFNIVTGALTGKSWSISGLVTPTNEGIEALTFVPNGSHPYADSTSGGLFYAGIQSDGSIHVYDVNLAVSGSSVTEIDSFTPVSGRTDIADLFFDTNNETLFISYDSANILTEMTTDGEILAEYSFPSTSTDQEGIVVIDSYPDTTGTFYIAQDSGPTVGPVIWEYGNFPITYLTIDADSDGVNSTLDCNDADATVSTNQTYYLDSDRDTFGSTATTSICASSAPLGYAANSLDCNDASASISPSAVEICDSIDNDCDGSIDEGVSFTYYRDADSDGLGDPAVSTTTCSSTAPSGYVSNNTDTSDTSSSRGRHGSGGSGGSGHHH